ncbi:MAG: hypothetical protein LBQ33_01910 [Oscillospiraceae bacterium]|jgi:hypothetical protein|nr:hypothetical protein [Oscillospiraceae bacterium]
MKKTTAGSPAHIRLLAAVLGIVCLFTTIGGINAHATAGYAYSIGGEFFNGDDVRSACDYFALCGYSSYYTCNPTYSYMNSSSRLNSDVVYFSAHGGQHAIEFYHINPNTRVADTYDPSKPGMSTVLINNFTLSNTKLYIYDACETAMGTTKRRSVL